MFPSYRTLKLCTEYGSISTTKSSRYNSSKGKSPRLSKWRIGFRSKTPLDAGPHSKFGLWRYIHELLYTVQYGTVQYLQTHGRPLESFLDGINWTVWRNYALYYVYCINQWLCSVYCTYIVYTVPYFFSYIGTVTVGSTEHQWVSTIYRPTWKAILRMKILILLYHYVWYIKTIKHYRTFSRW